MAGNNLTLNHKRLIIFKRFVIIKQMVSPSWGKVYYFTVVLHFSWMVTSALAVNQTSLLEIAPVFDKCEKNYCLQQFIHWILTTAMTGISTPRFPALLEAWRRKRKCSKHLQKHFWCICYKINSKHQTLQVQFCILQRDVHKVVKRAPMKSTGLNTPWNLLRKLFRFSSYWKDFFPCQHTVCPYSVTARRMITLNGWPQTSIECLPDVSFYYQN